MLSFPAPPAAGASVSEPGAVHLGDIAIACETVMREAREQGRTDRRTSRTFPFMVFCIFWDTIIKPTAMPSRWKGSSAKSSPAWAYPTPMPRLMLETGCDVRQFCPHDR